MDDMSFLADTSVTWVPRADTFGARLALVRQRFGWNMKEAALACGLPQNSWLEWETKGRTPRNIAEVSQKIREHTGADDYWLMTGKENGTFPDGPTPPSGGISENAGNREKLRFDNSQGRVIQVRFGASEIAEAA